MATKLVLVNGGERGAPRKNKSNKKGNVRVAITLSGSEGNVSKSFTVADSTVTEVYGILSGQFATAE